MRRRFYQNNKNINYFTINAVEDTTFSYTNRLRGCFIDEDEWFDIDMNESIFIKGGRGIKIKSKNTTISGTFGRFSIVGLCDITGEILSIMPGYTKDDPCPYLAYLFSGCTGIRHINESFLPFTNLIDGCYMSMFDGCTSLITAPELPAATLAIDCYADMFYNCTSLTTAPELPATTLVDRCYERMFYGCISLNYIKAMFTTTPSTTYTHGWVDGVASSGTFVKNIESTWNVTATSGNYYIGIPSGWIIQKTNK